MQPNSFLAFIGIIMIITALAGDILIQGFSVEQEPTGTQTEQTSNNNTTGYWIRELDETGTTTVPSGPAGTPVSRITYTFNVKEKALEGYVNLTSLSENPREDLDLYVYDPQGNEYSSAGPTAEEQVHLKKNDMKRGGAGEWDIEIQTFTGGYMILPIEYQITADVFYNGTNGSANNTTARQNSEENFFTENKENSHVELILTENTLQILKRCEIGVN